MPEDTELQTEQPSESSEQPAPAAQPTPLAPGQVMLNLTPTGLFAATVTQIGIDEATMTKIVADWLKMHPELADELLKARIDALRAAKNHLALVTPSTEAVRRINKRSKLMN